MKFTQKLLAVIMALAMLIPAASYAAPRDAGQVSAPVMDNGELIMPLGQSYTLNNTSVDSYNIEDNAIVSVDANGIVTARQMGTTEVTIRYTNGSTERVPVTVSAGSLNTQKTIVPYDSTFGMFHEVQEDSENPYETLVGGVSVTPVFTPVSPRMPYPSGFSVGGHSPTTAWGKWTINGEVVFCVDPKIWSNPKGPSTETTAYGNLTDGEKELVALMIEYGWNRSSKTTNDHVVTQVMIWELVEGILSTRTLSQIGGSAASAPYKMITAYNLESKYATLRTAVKNAMNATSGRPSFTTGDVQRIYAFDPSYTFQIAAGQTINLTDTNGVLSKWNFSNGNGLSFSRSGNTLTVTASASFTQATIITPASSNSGVNSYSLVFYLGSGNQPLADVVTSTSEAPKAYCGFYPRQPEGEIFFDIALDKIAATMPPGTTEGGAAYFNDNEADGLKWYLESSRIDYPPDNSGLGYFKTSSQDIVPGSMNAQFQLTLEDENGNVTTQTKNALETFTFPGTPGRYTIREVTPPNGFFLSTWGASFVIRGMTDATSGEHGIAVFLNDFQIATFKNSEMQGQTIALTAPNGSVLPFEDELQYGILEFDKVLTSGPTTEDLSGYRFVILAAEDIIIPALVGQPAYNNGVAYKAGDFVGMAVSDATGHVTHEYLPAGKYIVFENDDTQGAAWRYLAPPEDSSGNPIYKPYAPIYNPTTNRPYAYGFDNTDFTNNLTTAPIRTITNHLGTEGEYPNTTPKRQVKIVKKSTVGGTLLAGAVFEIKNGEGTVVDTLTTDANGTDTSIALPYGTYTITETTPPAGYTGTYRASFTLSATTAAVLTLPDITNTPEIKTAQVKIIKKAATDGKLLRGAVFEIKNAAGTVVDTLTTDANGTDTSIALPYGAYTITETTPPVGYTGAYTGTFTLNAESGPILTLPDITNEEIKANAVILKKGEGGERLAGAVFEVRNAAGTVVDTMTTSASGSATTKYLPHGNYTLVETKAPEGYIGGYTTQFTVSGTATTIYLADAINVKKDTPMGRIQIFKRGPAFVDFSQKRDTGLDVVVTTPIWEERYLADATFEVHAAEEITSPNGDIIYRKDQTALTLITESTGATLSTPLPAGKYYVIETVAPAGTVLNTSKTPITVQESGVNNVDVSVVSVTNTRQDVRIRMTKDIVQPDGTANAWDDSPVTIYTQTTGKTYKETTDKSGIWYGLYTAEQISGTGVTLPKNTLVSVARIGTNGSAVLGESAPAGRYYIKEIAAPDCFTLDETKYPVSITPTVNAAGTYEPSLLVTKGDNGKLLEMQDETKNGMIVIKKISETSEPINGVVFEVTDTDTGKVVDKFETQTIDGKKGMGESKPLPYGRYRVRETYAPKPYIAEYDEIFVITGDGSVTQEIKITVTNKKGSGTIIVNPPTGGLSNVVRVVGLSFRKALGMSDSGADATTNVPAWPFIAACSLLMTAGIALLVVHFIRRRKRDRD